MLMKLTSIYFVFTVSFNRNKKLLRVIAVFYKYQLSQMDPRDALSAEILLTISQLSFKYYIYPRESFCEDYVITGVRLSVCLSVTTITK